MIYLRWLIAPSPSTSAILASLDTTKQQQKKFGLIRFCYKVLVDTSSCWMTQAKCLKQASIEFEQSSWKLGERLTGRGSKTFNAHSQNLPRKVSSVRKFVLSSALELMRDDGSQVFHFTSLIERIWNFWTFNKSWLLQKIF